MPFGWNGSAVAPVQHQVVVAERDLVLAEQRAPARLAARSAARLGDRRGVDGLGRLALAGRGSPPGRCRGRGRWRRASRTARPAPAARWSSTPSSSKPVAKVRAARIGPTVCELDGPMPIVNRSNTLMATPPSSPEIGLCMRPARTWPGSPATDRPRIPWTGEHDPTHAAAQRDRDCGTRAHAPNAPADRVRSNAA